MPFYEYECQSCKFYAEVMQKISDPPLAKCPSCGKRTMRKLISAPVFRLKGSGWYETDFKSDKEEKRNLAVEREEAKPAAEESKSDTKAPAPAAETPAKPSEPKPPSITTAAATPKRPAAAPQKRAAAKVSPRPATSRAKAKPAPRKKTAKRGSRR